MELDNAAESSRCELAANRCRKSAALISRVGGECHPLPSRAVALARVIATQRMQSLSVSGLTPLYGPPLRCAIVAHAAAAVANGLALSKLHAYQAGFSIFSDFQRGVRLSPTLPAGTRVWSLVHCVAGGCTRCRSPVGRPKDRLGRSVMCVAAASPKARRASSPTDWHATTQHNRGDVAAELLGIDVAAFPTAVTHMPAGSDNRALVIAPSPTRAFDAGLPARAQYVPEAG